MSKHHDDDLLNTALMAFIVAERARQATPLYSTMRDFTIRDAEDLLRRRLDAKLGGYQP